MTIESAADARRINQLHASQPGSVVRAGRTAIESSFELTIDGITRRRTWVSGVLGLRLSDMELAGFAETIHVLHAAADVSEEFIPHRFRR